jgi:hypothetical protein
MNFKSIIVLGLSVATLGLSLPAHADDTANSVNSTQSAIITGDGNFTNQTNTTNIRNSQTGRRTTSSGNTGTNVNSTQSADVQGDDNSTNQNNSTSVTNSKRRTTTSR